VRAGAFAVPYSVRRLCVIRCNSSSCGFLLLYAGWFCNHTLFFLRLLIEQIRYVLSLNSLGVML